MGFFSETKAAMEIAAKLKGKLRHRPKRKLQFNPPYYWLPDDSTPFCPRCYDAEGLEIRLFGPTHYANGWARDCKNCETRYQETHESTIMPIIGKPIFDPNRIF